VIVLGIETSCDETGVGIVRDGKKILSNVVESSLKIHSRYGGVVPEIASRMQLESIAGVYREAVRRAGIEEKDIDLIAVTSGPGLPGSLLVGVSFGKGISLGLGKPIIGVNHVHSHIYANFLCHEKIKLPAVSLVVSGGHTSLFYVKDFSDTRLLGQTRDDACGEAFDKVAKIMGLGYPGGPLIERLAERGDSGKIKFSCSGTKGELDFSFSGVKTAVLYCFNGCRRKTGLTKADLAASFQESAVKALVKKSLLACKLRKTGQLMVGGGVAANTRLRKEFLEASAGSGIKCFFPDMGLCMDNAAMVAGLAFHLYKHGTRSDLYLNTVSSN